MEKEFNLSIITPYHEIDPEVFKKGFESMKAQKYGFDRIEWIIVIHNSAESYHTAVKELVAGYDNVKVCRLDNDKKTPSSPRNYGLKLATGRYVGFLDGDDSYTPECFLGVIPHISRSKAQIAVFRREAELENENLAPIVEKVLWDQTRDEIIIDREHWEDEKMFYGLCGMVTSRVYDRQFLADNGVWFDETVPFGEDFLFNLEAYGHAEKICYLPQLIGYHYFINSGSLVQSSKKDSNTLISYAQGYVKIFETGLNYGFYMNCIIQSLCTALSRFMVKNDLLDVESRYRIRDILKPYLDMTTRMAPSRVYPEKVAREKFEFPREVILHPEKWAEGSNDRDFMVTNEDNEGVYLSEQETLRGILSDNAGSDMGKRFGFSEILTVSGYQSRMPITEYDFYLPMIALTARVGETEIYTSAPISNYLVKFGSMRMPKPIPATEAHLKPYIDQFGLLLENNSSLLLYSSVPHYLKFAEGANANSLAGAVLAGYCLKEHASGRSYSDLFTTPEPLLFPEKREDFLYAYILFGLKNRKLSQIIAQSSWKVWEAFKLIQTGWRELCEDIENGDLAHLKVDSDSDIQKISGRLYPDPERARELREIFEKGFDEPVALKIWPSLSRIVAITPGIYQIYTDILPRYTGNVPIRCETFEYPEALLGIETTRDGIYKLDARDAFLEFIPVSDGKEINTPIQVDDVKTGQEYSLLVTNKSGFYRYRLNGIIKVTDIIDSGPDKGVPLFTYEYNTNNSVKLQGISVNEKQIYEALKHSVSLSGLTVTDYAYMEDYENDRLIFFMEFDEQIPADKEKILKIQQSMDDCIGRAVAGYGKGREENLIKEPVIRISNPETQLLYRDVIRYKLDLPSSNIPPVRKISSPADEKYFMKQSMEL
ncbi:MAG: GH3 auxin-responsive promoter family protein [Lachnospiraceae bacterium]|nr:GH3 auxin-responsive promoter family protein [Lachnospiraceae bacterium]